DRLRGVGKKVIGGGMHPSMMPEEAAEHFDAVCEGECEEVWNIIVDDAENGTLKKIYQGTEVDLKNIPVPDRKIFTRLKSDELKMKYDWEANMIQVMRGCTYECESCIIPVQHGKGLRFRPVENVRADIESLKFREFFITDDSIILPKKECLSYSEKLFTAISETNSRIFLSGTLNMKTDPEYLKMLKTGGVVSIYLVTGYDPLSITAFKKGGKKFFNWSLEIIKKLQDSGLHLFLSFGLGFDYQDQSIFDTVLEFGEKAGIGTAEFYILTPYPKTPAYNKFIKEDRLLHRNWEKYTTSNVVFKPAQITEKELLDGYIYCWKEFYKNRDGDDSVSIFTPREDKIK
ncbi:MAG: hypothetical protein KAS39_05725, partial [Actinomycetia bacterium]|nr:hypothetical protein [Actinomycetes bacterium]